MKKRMILIVILLVGCSSPIANPFVYDDNCPRLCWLGINPGVTTFKEAKELINSSRTIDKKSLQLSDNSISTDWFTGRSEAFPCSVNIESEGELVESISFGGTPYKTNEFITLLGEPDEIYIRLVTQPDAEYIEYFVYYLSSKTLIEATFADQNGPDPNDRVFGLVLNSEFSKEILPSGSGNIQPWLGYGHVMEYLQDQ